MHKRPDVAGSSPAAPTKFYRQNKKENTKTNDFINKLRSAADDEFNTSETENGAIGYRTTGKALLNINFAVSSMRDYPERVIENDFATAFFENKLLAVKWLFFAGDVRGGMGERRLFRTCLHFLADCEPDLVRRLLPLIPEYSRWDNVLPLLTTAVENDVLELIKTQLNEDIAAMAKHKPVSLLAKWLPSVNASSADARLTAKAIMASLGMTAKQYRKTLSELRKYADVVEVKMSAGKWNKIDYSQVPSCANLLYKKAFLLHDEKRRTKFLESLKQGKATINATVLFPHDIVARYCTNELYRCKVGAYDETLEQLWKALPDYAEGDGTTLCVADGSGSMFTPVGNSGIMAIHVANALAIYFAERCKGQYKDTYITFSENPQFVSFAHCGDLHDKIGVALSHDEIANTNIEAVFDLILTTAVKNKLPQSDLPRNILILSDMEFDCCACVNSGSDEQRSKPDIRLFEDIKQRYAEHGYKLPRLVFWNICSRTGTIPLKENELGVALVSGFSPTSLKMVLSSELDPYKCLIEQINSARYDAVEKAFLGK